MKMQSFYRIAISLATFLLYLELSTTDSLSDANKTFRDEIIKNTSNEFQIDAVESISVPIERANFPANNSNFTCHFESGATNWSSSGNTTFKKEDSVYFVKCQAPKRSDFPPLSSNGNYFNATLTIDTDTFFKRIIQIKFFDCETYKSCQKCVSSTFPCAWCPKEKKCTYNATQNCATIHPTKIKPDIILPAGKYEVISMSKLNLSTICEANSNIKCLINIEGKNSTKKATIKNDDFFCENTTFTYAKNTSNVTASVVVLWNTSTFSDILFVKSVGIYKCHNMARNCTTCMNLDAKYGCKWCLTKGSCEYRDNCPKIIPKKIKPDIILPAEKYEVIRMSKSNLSAICEPSSNLKCLITIEGKNSTKKATIKNDDFVCENTSFTYAKNTSNVTASVAVLWGTPTFYDILSVQSVVIYKCQNMAHNCTTCMNLDAKYGCKWCLTKGSCEYRDYCPKIDTTKIKPDIILPDGNYGVVSMSKPNLSEICEPNSSLKCLITIEGKNSTKNATIKNDDFVCENTSFTYAKNTSNVTASVAVLWVTPTFYDILSVESVVIYKCQNMAHNSTTCMNLDAKYGCKWYLATDSCEYHGNCKGPSGYTHNNESMFVIYSGAILGALAILLSLYYFFCLRKSTVQEIGRIEQQTNSTDVQETNSTDVQETPVRQYVKNVVVGNRITLDGELKLPNVTIEYVSTPIPENSTRALQTHYILPDDNKWEFPRSKLLLGKCLGDGRFGRVVVGEALGILPQYSTLTVAVKMLKDTYLDSDMINLVSEMEMMKLIGTHNNVLQLLGCCTQNGSLLIITEFARHGNLRDFLRRHVPSESEVKPMSNLSAENLLDFALQIAEGMEYLASKKYIHRDLAARRVLVTEDYVMKINDFGLNKKKAGDESSVKWMAPEVFCHSNYSTQSDVWSYGILLWEIFTLGDEPYSTFLDTRKLYRASHSGYRMEKPSDCPDKMYRLMRKCWSFIPDGRPSFSEIKQNLNEMISSDEESIIT